MSIVCVYLTTHVHPSFHYKVYHMASLRLRDLCMRLDVGNDLLEKVKLLSDGH